MIKYYYIPSRDVLKIVCAVLDSVGYKYLWLEHYSIYSEYDDGRSCLKVNTLDSTYDLEDDADKDCPRIMLYHLEELVSKKTLKILDNLYYEKDVIEALKIIPTVRQY